MRQEVFKRADYKCEYCLYPEEFALHAYEIDHILSRKHGGENFLENLALACLERNRRKGTDIASYDDLTGEFDRIF